jgi:ribulose-phosphate 3-epimerase
MVDNPGDLLEPLAEAGAYGCTVHIELGDPTRLIGRMRGLGLHPGLVLNPETPFDAVAPFLHLVDLLLVMSVHPGFGGQRFIRDVLPKLTAARQLAEERGLGIDLQIDGGIGPSNAADAVNAGANVLVAGSAIFEAEDPLLAARRIREAATSASGPTVHRSSP